MKCLLALALVLAFATSAAAAPRTVLVLVYDGWAPALVQDNDTPALDRMRAEGAWTHHMEPAFPTISLINGVTISTGCWPEHHGIVTNIFRDPERGVYDHSPDADWLTGCEHLQQAAERQGVKSAALGWYGSYSGSKGPQATYVGERSHDQYPDDRGRAAQVIELLRKPEAERPRLILSYFKGPDGAEHFTGMDSEETRAALRQADESVGRILDAVDALPYGKDVTVLVTTDHGMAPVSWVVNVKKILRNNGIEAEALSTGTTSFLYFEGGDAAVERAHRILAAYDEFEVIRPEAQPEYSHLGTGPRAGDLIISTRPPYFIEDIDRWPSWARWIGRWGPEFMWAGMSLKASHGYPPDTPGMHGILYARGAGIAKGRAVERVRAIDVHPTVVHLLGIESGRPVDGKVAKQLLE